MDCVIQCFSLSNIERGKPSVRHYTMVHIYSLTLAVQGYIVALILKNQKYLKQRAEGFLTAIPDAVSMTARLCGFRYHDQSLEVPHTKLSGWILVPPIPLPHFIHFSPILEKLVGMPGKLLLHFPMEKERSVKEVGGESSLGIMPISLRTQNSGTGE